MHTLNRGFREKKFVGMDIVTSKEWDYGWLLAFSMVLWFCFFTCMHYFCNQEKNLDQNTCLWMNTARKQVNVQYLLTWVVWWLMDRILF